MSESMIELNRQIDSIIEKAESIRGEVQKKLEKRYKDSDWLKKGDIVYFASDNGTGKTFISAIVIDEGNMSYFSQNMAKVRIRQKNIKVKVLSRISADKYQVPASVNFETWYYSHTSVGSLAHIYSHNPHARTRIWQKQEWMEQNVFGRLKVQS
jgi:hypothetical protein